jgi:hypothetical protein
LRELRHKVIAATVVIGVILAGAFIVEKMMHEYQRTKRNDPNWSERQADTVFRKGNPCSVTFMQGVAKHLHAEPNDDALAAAINVQMNLLCDNALSKFGGRDK